MSTMWLTTVFGNGSEIPDYIGQPANVTSFTLNSTSDNSSIDDLAHIYLAY